VFQAQCNPIANVPLAQQEVGQATRVMKRAPDHAADAPFTREHHDKVSLLMNKEEAPEPHEPELPYAPIEVRR
jgi:hypothetical protein